MEPTIEKFLQGIPFAGMGSTLERNGLIGVVRELIKANKYTVDYILNYCESVGYQRKMTEEVFEELTGLSPKLIINNNEYYNAPIYVPACTIAWGLAKSKKDVAFYVVPGSYGYSVMEKNETDTPTEITQTATIPEAIDELKKVAKNIQTLDKIITSKLLETEDIQSSANDIDQTAKPYFSDPIRELKKNFKNKVIDINAFEREAKKLVAEEKITVNEAEDLMDWKQRLVDEDESYANEVLQNNEEWNQLQGTDEDGLDTFDYLYEMLLNGNITEYKEKLNKMTAKQIVDYISWAEEMGIDKAKLNLHYIQGSKKVESNFTSEQEEKFKHLWELHEQGNISEYETELKNMEGSDVVKFVNWMGFYGKDASSKKATNIPTGNVPTEKITLVDGRTFTVRYNPKEKGITTIFNEDGKEIGVDAATRLQLLRKLFHKGEPTIVNENPKTASKKVTAENIDLDDIEEEDKTEVEQEMDKIEETPIAELLEDNTPLDYFEKETQNDKVDTINDVVSRCITEFSDKFKDFDKYDVKMLSYKTKILAPYTPNQDEMIPDNEVNADAVLQVILAINNKADDSNIKKVLAVFSITDGKMHWTGTVRDENDKVVAFTEQGLDSIFNDEEPEEVEEVI